MIQKIIIATDYSAEAENAMIYAAKAAAQVGYEVILFHLYNFSIHALNARVSGDELDKHLKKAENSLVATATSLASDYRIKVRPHLATGLFLEEINRAMKLHDAGLLVMGMPGKSLEQELLGNTTTSAIGQLSFPVLAVPLNAAFRGIEHIIFACDMVRGVQKQVLEEVKHIVADFGAIVEVFHVGQTVEYLLKEQKERISEAMNGVGYFYKNVVSEKVIAAIKEEIAETRTDLLIMVPYHYGFWGSVVHRSRTRVMASESNVPLLSIPVMRK